MFYLGPVDSDDDDDSDAPVSGQLPDMSTVQRHSAAAKLTVQERTVNVNERVMPTHTHEEAPAGDGVAEAESAGDGDDDIQSAPLESFDGTAPQATPGLGTGGAAPDLDVILDIPVTISMEIGRTQINIRNLLQLNQGSVVELDRLAGEPMDVMVNGTLIAQGEVVVVNEKFGIRLTDVISPSERVKRLGK